LHSQLLDDYAVATGQSHTLTQFVGTVFNLIGKDWRDPVTGDRQNETAIDTLPSDKVDRKTPAGLGWKPQDHIADVISMMLQAEKHD
jgi:GDPmannose 4,6-dehydratase